MPDETQTSSKILVVDDDADTCQLLHGALTRRGHDVVTATSAHAALERLRNQEFALLLTDLKMPGMGGLELCERVKSLHPLTNVVLVTGHADIGSAVAAMRLGAYDFLAKPLDEKILGACVDRALEHRRLSEEILELRRAVAASRARSGILGASPVMVRVLDLVGRVGPTEASVLIHGETGTGKELVARAIHEASPRRTGPFVGVSCAAIPASLLENELFGHSKGAFTDARTARRGLLVEANGGTLFLDEVGELPLEMQAKLLRVLQERSVRPLGGNAEVPFDVRLVTATNRELDDEVFEKRFREDLYYRINVVRIDLPPLRARVGDVLLLAQHFLHEGTERFGKPPLTLSTGAAEKLLAYAWPGNVRELANCMERVVALARSSEVSAQDLPEKVQAYQPDRFVVPADDPSELMTMAELERRYLLRVLRVVGGNKSRAASILGLDRRTLYRKLAQYARSRPSEVPPSLLVADPLDSLEQA